MAAWGQSPNDSSSGAVKADPVKIDRATAYYHFVLAHMYSEMAEASVGVTSREYEKQVNEHYKLAVKADPATPDPRALLSPFAPIYIYIPKAPASRQERSRP